MFDENPMEIQEGVPGSFATPLILMHDGGGTTFDYHFIDLLDREVWGIHNPRFDSGEPWEGGIAEMAAHYISLVRTVVPSGHIILGGWSLGGLLSLEMARQMAEDSDLKVKGIVMVDTPYPKQKEGVEKPCVQRYVPAFNSHTSAATQASVTKSFANTYEALQTYKMPVWNEASGMVPPPTALLRAKEYVEVPPGIEKGLVMRVDVHREQPLLGWELYQHQLVDAVSHLTSHHFNPFKLDHVDLTSEKIKSACRMIDTGILKKAADPKTVRQF